MSKELRDLMLGYMKDVKLMAISTSSGNKPWTATVFFAFDDRFNLYFLSRTHRRHSKEILENPNVSGVIFAQNFNLGDKTKGIQFEGLCNIVPKDEFEHASNLFLERFPKAKEHLANPEVRLWKIEPKLIKYFDEELFGSEGKELVL